MEKKYKFCILTTIGASVASWFEPIFSIYDNNKIETTFVANFDSKYFEFLTEKYKTIRFVQLDISRGVNPLKMISSFFVLLRLFKKEKFDLIEYHTPNASFCASLAGFFARIKRRVYGQWGIRYIGFKGLKRFVFWLVERITCKFSTIVFAQSPKNVKYNIDKHVCSKKKIDLIGIGGTIGVDLTKFDYRKKPEWNKCTREELGIDPNDFVFGYIGRIHKDKGLNELIEAFKHFPKGKLLVIGDLENKYSIRDDNLKYLLSSKSVFYLDRIKNDLVPRYASAIDLFIYPTYREGFGHILQQIMALGIPIVTTNIPGPSEVIEDKISGILVEPHSSIEIFNSMNKLYGNTSELYRLGKEGRIRANRYFDMHIMVKNIKNNYEKMLGDKLYE